MPVSPGSLGVTSTSTGILNVNIGCHLSCHQSCNLFRLLTYQFWISTTSTSFHLATYVILSFVACVSCVLCTHLWNSIHFGHRNLFVDSVFKRSSWVTLSIASSRRPNYSTRRPPWKWQNFKKLDRKPDGHWFFTVQCTVHSRAWHGTVARPLVFYRAMYRAVAR